MVTIKNVNFHYDKKPLFNDLNFELSPGKIYGLIGKNGAGKTSLLKMIAGLLFPQQGQCQFLHYASKMRHPDMLKEIFFIPETYLLPKMTVQDYVNFYSPFYPSFKAQFFQEKLAEFQLDRNSPLPSFSYGQQKKFLLAFALSTSVKLLLLDEPTNGIDIPSQRVIRRMIIEAIQPESSIIISTHHLKELEKTFDYLTIIDDGKILINHDLIDISSTFKSGITHDLNEIPHLIYSEKLAGGYSILQHKVKEEDSPLELDLFFSAVLSTPYEINRILNGNNKKNNESNNQQEVVYE